MGFVELNPISSAALRALESNLSGVAITDEIVNTLYVLVACAALGVAPHVEAAAPKAPASAPLRAPARGIRLPPPRFAFEVMGNTIPRGLVALTFDDGPHRQYTPALLRLLAKYQAPATFFMLGQNAKLNPDVAASVAKAGHSIGAHSYDHKKLTGLTEQALEAQVAGSQALVQGAIGRPVTLFRSPYGARDSRVIKSIDAAHMRHVLWSIDSRDWQDHDPVRTTQRIMTGLYEQGRGIVLLHDIHPTSIEATELLLRELQPLRRAGALRLVTVDQLLGFAPPAPFASLPGR